LNNPFVPPKHFIALFILRLFQVGVEGRAYHVCDNKGSQAVVKFFQTSCKFCEDEQNFEEQDGQECEKGPNCKETQKKEALEKCENEKKNDIEIQIITLDNQPALLMPYLEPVSEKEKREFLTETSQMHKTVVDLVRSLVKKGCLQTDASWRHIGL